MKPQTSLFSGHACGGGLLLLFFFLIIQFQFQCDAHSSEPLLFAQRLIRDLNLLPSIPQDQDQDQTQDSNQTPRLVENRIHLPILGDSGTNASVDELGHHAGYYQLQHTHAAK